MTPRERIPLAQMTTFRVGGPARFVYDCADIESVRAALAYARANNLPYLVIGEGSNILASDEGFDGVVIHITIPGIQVEPEDDEHARIICGAGVAWEAVVREAASRNLWSIENMAGIPGTIGAAPVQNIGAYGTELAHTLVYVTALDADTDTIVELDADSCRFGYRESRFKEERNLIILEVALRLSRTAAPQLGYSDLARLNESGVPLRTPVEIGEAVREVRAQKFPDLSVSGTAGSFFKNPVVSEEKYLELCGRYGELPRFSAVGGVKIPLAFVLDKILNLKGYRLGKAYLFGNQPLVLVADQDACARDVDALAQEIETRVLDATGIRIEREVRCM